MSRSVEWEADILRGKQGGSAHGDRLWPRTTNKMKYNNNNK